MRGVNVNLLIVEDEPLLLNSLAEMPWERSGIEVIGLAANGHEALQLIARKRPDLVLLDICMPQMDGLELVKIVRSRDPDMKCVILSGHDTFSFVQKAMELGVTQYLLKPAGETEILQAVSEAAEQLRCELEERHSRAVLQTKWQDHLPRLQDMFLHNLLTGKYALWEIERRSKELLIELPTGGSFVVAVIDMDPLSAEERRFSEHDIPLLQFSANSIAREFLATSEIRSWTYSNTTGETVVIFCSADECDQTDGSLLLYVHSVASRLLGMIRECLKLTASVGVSRAAGSFKSLSELYKQARKSLKERIVFGNDIVIPYHEEHGRNGMAVPSVNLEKAFEIGLETGDVGKALATLEELWNSGIAEAHTASDVHDHLLFLSSLIVRMISRQGWSAMQVVGKEYYYFLNLHALATKEQAYEWLKRVTRQYIDYLHNERKSSMNRTIKLILDIVEQDIDKDISLFSVADRLYVNSSYLSRLFKQQVGKPFSAYVLDRRMERAKQLLLDGCKVYDTAFLVGYKDESYFARVFRKYWSISPSEIKV